MSKVSVDNIQPIGSGTSVTVNSAATLVVGNINSSGVVTATTFKGSFEATSASFSSNIDANGDLDVDGHTFLDNVSVGGATTCNGDVKISRAAGTDARLDINEGTTTNPLRIMQTATEARIITNASQPFNIRSQSGSGSTGYLAFWTRDFERIRITSGGDVGINTTAPQNGAHFQHFQSTVRHQSFQSTDGDLAIITDNNNNPALYIKGTGTADLVNIFDNATEVFTIRDGGNVGIGVASPDQALTVSGRVKTDDRFNVTKGSNGTIFNYDRTGVGALFIIDNLSNESNTRMRIRNTQGIINYNSSSDYRLKENDVNIADGITRIKKLRPIRFNWIKDKTTTYDGFFAHEVSDACPEAVDGTKDQVALEDDSNLELKKGDPIYQGIDNSKLIPLLTAALQESIAKIEVLEAEVTALKGS